MKMRLPKPSNSSVNTSSTNNDNNPKNMNKNLEFRNKVESSNQNAICTASTNVGLRTINNLLQANKYHVPIFQRRYCWTEVQWDTILKDALIVQGAQSHSLGRLTCTNNAINNSSSSGKSIDDERSCILDGQQRFTTITILLASIRDAVIKSGHSNHALVLSINKLLFIDLNAMREYDMNNLIKKDNQEYSLSEGIELPFTRLIPTFCDRLSYYMSILPHPMEDENKKIMSHVVTKLEEHITWYRPLQAKQYFDNKLKKKFNHTNKLVSLAKNILHKFTMLYFPISIDKGHDDGTEDLMVIYERLAMRDATWCKPHRQQEYVSMSSSDMIRNLLLGSFSDQENAIEFYKRYWLPMEQISSHDDQHNVDDGMNILIQNFLKEQGFYDNQQEIINKKKKKYDDNNNPASYIIGDKLYADFQLWLSSSFRLERSSNRSEFDSEQLIMEVGKKMLEYVKY